MIKRNPIIKRNKELWKIRKLYATKNYTHKELGKIFGLRPNYIGEITRCNLWKHIQ